MNKRLLALLAFAAAGLASPLAAASPTCNLSGEHLMSWPTAQPGVADLLAAAARRAAGTNGSGLEIRNVYYNGHLVLKRGHVPMLNVEYDPGGCGCYRDWLYQEVVFHAEQRRFPASPATPSRRFLRRPCATTAAPRAIAARRTPTVSPAWRPRSSRTG